MNLKNLKLSILYIVVFVLFCAGTSYAQNLITASFSNGFVGDNTGNNSSGNAYYLNALGWTNAQFAQSTSGNVFVAQGNDIIGMVLLTDVNGTKHQINGFIKWRAPSGNVTTLVFQPSVSVTLATNSANGTPTYTIDNTKYIGLTFNGSTLAISGGNVSGNAATQGLLDALNNYLDQEPKITISSASLNVLESVGNASLTVTLSGTSSSTITVKYATQDATALAGTDYTQTSGTLSFTPGGPSSQTVNIPIIDDADPETSESFKVNFFDPVNASLLGNEVQVNIADNENVDSTPPVITGPNGNSTTTAATAAKSIPENTTAVGSYTANETVSWSISGTDASKFSITSSGVLTFATAPDFENPTDVGTNNTYIVIITATDAAGNTTTQTLTVTVTDVDEIAPVITGPNGNSTTTAATAAKSIPENTTAVGSYTANETVSWSISGTDASKFSITSSGVLTFATAPDFENPTDVGTNNTYIVIITATDAAGNTTTQTLTVTVTDVDEIAPVITGPNGNSTTTAATAAKSIPENTTAVGSYTANETVSWSISGTDASKFSITSSGVLTFATAPDFENPTDVGTNNTYIVIITATDAAGNTTTQTLTVTVTDVDEIAPVITGPNGNSTTTAATAAKSIPENTTAVGSYTANETVSWSISGTDASKFSITSSGVLTFATAPDFENPTDVGTNNTYIVIITATDAAGNTTTQTLTVTVTNVVENLAPTDITLSRMAIYEGNAINAIVGNLTSTDPDVGDTHTYTLVNGQGSDHNDVFTIQNNQLRAAITFEFKNQTTYSIRLRTTDAGGLTYEKIFVIEVLKAPYATGTGNISGPGQITAAGYNVTISKGLSAPLNILGSGLVSYSWSPATGLSATNIANPVASPLQTTTYAVTVTNNQGISTVVYVTVTVVEDYNVKPNTVITPNGDGKNDAWVISNLLTYPNNQVQVYDKAGRLLLNKTNYQNDWDGTINGSPLAEGTYYYVIKFDVPQQQIIKGYLTIIRD